MGDRLTYLYAVARDAVPGCPEGVAAVRTIAQAGLVAYVSSVPLERFGEQPLRRSLADMHWLGETARAHHRVVDAVAAATPTAPVRLVTVYEGDEQVRGLLDRRAGDFLAVLSRVAGRREWGVKAYAASSPEDCTAEHSGKPGTSSSLRRRAGLRGREHARRQALARAEHIHAALATVAVASHRTQDPRLSGRPDWMLLNRAYLVDVGREEEFAAMAAESGGNGVEVALTGPWAPYSFTVTDAR
ncbi:GvpL/GvpF family gas vesicle protein [Nonomuraea turkmeniaca]|uniref:GvpL/GvpF family gas vesicle protein n=2 Tax=Nonomuraea turkmeniaca TaxID=103838 RepID=A0A5S4FD12_9ACTN|nr:GvpL/GvpF family gas vesicle protein [Nonomuraea turkmeniaca]